MSKITITPQCPIKKIEWSKCDSIYFLFAGTLYFESADERCYSLQDGSRIEMDFNDLVIPVDVNITYTFSQN